MNNGRDNDPSKSIDEEGPGNPVTPPKPTGPLPAPGEPSLDPSKRNEDGDSPASGPYNADE